MTHDSTHLDSLSSLHSSVSVKTVDGTPLPVVGQGTLYTSSFHVLSVSHLPQLHVSSSLLARLLIMVVVPFLILTFVLFRIIAPGPWLVLAVSSMILLVFGSLTDCIFLQLLLRASRLPLLMPLLLSSPPLLALLSGIIV
jgi:hypothetical protein